MPDRALLLLADIAGYTEFMRLHRLNLAHSQEITRRLLESMLDAVPALTLVEVEGDALFLSAPHEQQQEPDGSSGWLPAALAMYQAFHARQQWMVAHNLCVCDACRQIGKLHVKFVVHLGDVVSQRIRESEKLVGVDVIAVHRMLKNSVPAAEYVLMSEPLYQSPGTSTSRPCRACRPGAGRAGHDAALLRGAGRSADRAAGAAGAGPAGTDPRDRRPRAPSLPPPRRSRQPLTSSLTETARCLLRGRTERGVAEVSAPAEA
jgi:hypothetical protein